MKQLSSLIITMLVGIYLGQQIESFAPIKPISNIENPVHPLEQLFRYLESQYVDEIDREKLIKQVLAKREELFLSEAVLLSENKLDSSIYLNFYLKDQGYLWPNSAKRTMNFGDQVLQ